MTVQMDVRDSASVTLARRLGSRPEVHHLQNWVNKGEWTDTASPGEPTTYISAHQYRQPRRVTPRHQNRPVNSQGSVLILFTSTPEWNETQSAIINCRHFVPPELR